MIRSVTHLLTFDLSPFSSNDNVSAASCTFLSFSERSLSLSMCDMFPFMYFPSAYAIVHAIVSFLYTYIWNSHSFALYMSPQIGC